MPAIFNPEPATPPSDQRFVYWMPPEAFTRVRDALMLHGYSFTPAILTPCQALRSQGRRLVYTAPEKWSGFCNRQGAWYRDSHRNGDWMLVSDHELPKPAAQHLDTRLAPSDFSPESLPTQTELEQLLAEPDYNRAKPAAWERLSRLDAPMFKIFFSLIGIWRRGDNLKRHWVGHRANHANFLTRRFTARVDGEDVPYSVTENRGVCSSCVQFFNLMRPRERKMVRSCPGAITFARARRNLYYDVRPVALTISAAAQN